MTASIPVWGQGSLRSSSAAVDPTSAHPSGTPSALKRRSAAGGHSIPRGRCHLREREDVDDGEDGPYPGGKHLYIANLINLSLDSGPVA